MSANVVVESKSLIVDWDQCRAQSHDKYCFCMEFFNYKLDKFSLRCVWQSYRHVHVPDVMCAVVSDSRVEKSHHMQEKNNAQVSTTCTSQCISSLVHFLIIFIIFIIYVIFFCCVKFITFMCNKCIWSLMNGAQLCVQLKMSLKQEVVIFVMKEKLKYFIK